MISDSGFHDGQRETIVAIATPPGRGGVGIVRISGPKALAIGPQIQETFRQAYRAGVKIAFGTDSGVSPHGDNAQEFVYMVEAGMPAFEALRSATIVPAQILGQATELGSIEAGKLADIIAVPGNPLEDIARMRTVDFVMKSGTIYKGE